MLNSQTETPVDRIVDQLHKTTEGLDHTPSFKG